MKYRNYIYAVLPVLFIIASCDDGQVRPDGPDNPSAGVYILNEGQFLADNASLSFFEFSSGRFYHQVFYTANGNTPLGDIAQSMVFSGGMAYIVVNNSGKIWGVDAGSFVFTGKISGLSSPRYMQIVQPGKAYVSDMYARRIHIVDPESFSITGFIDVSNPSGFPGQHSTETMLLHGDKLFVACWSFDNKILVIHTGTDRIIDSIEVPKQPNSMVLDRDGILWVLSDGGFPGSPYGHEKAVLTGIEPLTLEVRRMLTFGSINDSPVELNINPAGDSLYYLCGDVFAMSIKDTSLPDQPLIPCRRRNLYALGTDPRTGILYLADALDFRQRGWVYRYHPSGSVIDSMKAGVNPGYFCFRY